MIPTQSIGLAARFHAQALQNPTKTALISGEESLNYATLDHRITQVAHWLLSNGAKPGDRIGILWFNEIPTVILYLACFRAGLIALPIISRMKAPELQYIFDHARPSIFFAHPKLMTVAVEAQNNSAHKCPVFDSLPQDFSPFDCELPLIDEEKPTLIMYTSGTTARPKGVTHNHRSVLACARMMLEIGSFHVAIATTSMMHPSGLFCMTLPALLSGGTIVLQSAFDPDVTLDLFEQHRGTFCFLLPSFAQQLVAAQTKKPRKINSFEWIIAGGDTVPIALQNKFQELFGAPLCEGIGMTECCPMLVNPPHAMKPGSVGVPWCGVEARAVDVKGEAVPDGEIGELIIRSPANCTGYWENPKETANSLRDGWLFTGDLVCRDADGYFWFQGRKKQLIIRESYNISPQEVEEILYKHPAVFEVGVFGLPDPALGEKVIATVSLKPNHSVTEIDLREFAKKHLNDIKVPERILFLPELPKGLSGKVDRRGLKDMIAKEIS